jgi:DNA-binding transcriptional LysR family regulator
MNITLARTFLAIADTGSFVHAAERLHVTQSTVSSRMKALEDLLGRSLLKRSKAGATLTPAGQQFHKHALALVREWEHARLEVRLAETHRDHLSIGAQPSFWDGFLLPWLAWMHGNLPNIAVTAMTASSIGLMDRLIEGTLDLAVMYRPINRPGLIIEHLFDEELIMVSASGERRPPILDYVFVNWGREFEVDHALAFPDSRMAGLSLELGAIGVDAILATGGSGYFPMRTAQPLIDGGALTPVKRLPHFVYPAYAVYPEDRDEEAFEPILASRKRIASELPLSAARMGAEARSDQLTSKTTRPLILPATISGASASTSRKGCVSVMAASLARSRSPASRAQAAARLALGAITESTPASVTPRRMNGATFAGRSMPCARPQAATVPPYLICDSTLASVALPATSMAPAQRSLASGFGVPLNSSRATISPAPSDFR